MLGHRLNAATIRSGIVAGERRWFWLCLLSVQDGQPGACRPCAAGDSLTWRASWYAVKAHALDRHGVEL